MADPKDPQNKTTGVANGASNGATNGIAHHAPGADGEHEHEDEDEDDDEHEDDDSDGQDAEVEPASAGAIPPAPPAIAELCAACIRFVASKYKVALDGTPDTLSLVDQYVREAREAAKERPESVDLVAPAIGAYLGEVMRQAFGAEWFAEGSYESYRLYFSNVFLSLNPIGMAREAILLEEQEGWHAHLALDPGQRDIVEMRLSVMPEVDEEEYFLPSTRFDVIEVIVQTLRRHAEREGLSDVRFTREDYE